jgi:hypothetical protein
VAYEADIFESAVLDYDRAIRLRLKPSGSEPAHTVTIEFPLAASSDFVSIGSTFSAVRNKFDGMLHMLQTEKPLYFTASRRASQSAIGRRSGRRPIGRVAELAFGNSRSTRAPRELPAIAERIGERRLLPGSPGVGLEPGDVPHAQKVCGVDRRPVSSLGRPCGKVGTSDASGRLFCHGAA